MLAEASFLGSTRIELVSEKIPRGKSRHVIFDFDGTVSLIRQGWQQVMIPMMADLLAETPRAESQEDLERVVTERVTRTTGKQTIYQMFELCEMITERGGTAKDALAYKREYLRRLHERIKDRREGLRDLTVQPERMLVPGVIDMLEALRAKGLTLYAASGTDEPYVIEEARLLGVLDYFNGGLFGARDDYKAFSKRVLIERIVADHDLRGEELLTFGDGFVEIRETKAVGGVAVGVASDEERREGIDPWKRTRLIEAGADIIIPDFRESRPLIGFLFD